MWVSFLLAKSQLGFCKGKGPCFLEGLADTRKVSVVGRKKEKQSRKKSLKISLCCQASDRKIVVEGLESWLSG